MPFGRLPIDMNKSQVQQQIEDRSHLQLNGDHHLDVAKRISVLEMARKYEELHCQGRRPEGKPRSRRSNEPDSECPRKRPHVAPQHRHHTLPPMVQSGRSLTLSLKDAMDAVSALTSPVSEAPSDVTRHRLSLKQATESPSNHKLGPKPFAEVSSVHTAVDRLQPRLPEETGPQCGQVKLPPQSASVTQMREPLTSDNLLPAMYTETIEFDLPPEMTTETLNSGLLPDMATDALEYGMLPEMAAETIKYGLFPVVATETIESGLLPDMATETLESGMLPEMATETLESGMLPEMATETIKYGLFPVVATEIIESGLLPEVATETVESALLPEMTPKTIESGLLPEMTTETLESGLPKGTLTLSSQMSKDVLSTENKSFIKEALEALSRQTSQPLFPETANRTFQTLPKNPVEALSGPAADFLLDFADSPSRRTVHGVPSSKGAERTANNRADLTPVKRSLPKRLRRWSAKRFSPHLKRTKQHRTLCEPANTHKEMAHPATFPEEDRNFSEPQMSGTEEGAWSCDVSQIPLPPGTPPKSSFRRISGKVCSNHTEIVTVPVPHEQRSETVCSNKPAYVTLPMSLEPRSETEDDVCSYDAKVVTKHLPFKPRSVLGPLVAQRAAELILNGWTPGTPMDRKVKLTRPTSSWLE